MTVKLVGTDAENIQAQTPGEISAPGLRFTLEFTNAGSRPVSLDHVMVTGYLSNGAPLWLSTGQQTVPVAGQLRPGQSLSGTYAFAVGTADQDDVILTITHSPAAPAVRIKTS